MHLMSDTSESKQSNQLAFWIRQIETYERKFGPWEKRGKKIIARYRDERDSAKRRARFNILWSNVQTLQPALYASPPKPNVDRRWQEDDDLGRYAALALERSAAYFINDGFDDAVKAIVLDRLLPGRGTAWVRYEPTFEDSPQVSETEENYQDDSELVSEKVCVDYVHWQDFGHTWCRTWDENRAVWRRVYMDKRELKKRWPKVYKDIPLDAKEDGATDSDAATKACIYELWDKRDRKAIWLHKAMDDVLETLDDPLHLQDFFPCPKPLYATLTNEDLIPSPDYAQYQDQAQELDELTGRIGSVQKSLKVAGVYDGQAQGIDRLLSEGVENMLIPVDQWAVFGEKGLQGVMSLLPLGEITQALIAMYEARDKVKQDLYEITGISDIIRGASDPNETLGAQELKGKYAGLRLDDKQKDVANMCRSMVRIITEIIAEHFSIDTIKQISGLKLMTAVEKQQVQMQMQQQEQMLAQQGQQGNAPQPPQLPEDVQEMLELPTWEEIEQLIKNDTARSFRIDIETDSTIKTDQEADKKERIEFISAMGGFIQQAVSIPNPQLAPLLMQMISFAAKGFKIGREFETEIDFTINKIKKQAEQPQEQQPDPEIEKAKLQQQTDQAKLQQQAQIEQMKLQSSQQLEQSKLESSQMIEGQKLSASIQIEMEKEKIQQQSETQRLQMEIGKEVELEKIRQSFENERHAATLRNNAEIAANQPKETNEQA